MEVFNSRPHTSALLSWWLVSKSWSPRQYGSTWLLHRRQARRKRSTGDELLPKLRKNELSVRPCEKETRFVAGDSTSGQSVELGPMTLREYIRTLEPYDPEVHGWRGDEPLPKPRAPRPHPRANGIVRSPAKCAYTSVAYRASPRTRGLVVWGESWQQRIPCLCFCTISCLIDYDT